MDGFGDKSLDITKEWPSLDEISQFPLDKKIRINGIGFKRSGKNEPLTGISLEYTNGVRSPLF
jgi:hypothetical protein